MQVGVAIVGLLACAFARADWLNLSGAENAPNIAEITIYQDRVDVALEVYPDDLSRFETDNGIAFAVSADGTLIVPEVKLREQRTRKDRYSPYAGMLDPRTRRRVPGPPEDKGVIYFELAYPLTGMPKQLTFAPPLDTQGYASATVGLLVYHRSAPVIDFRYLSQPETINLDWRDPWFTTFQNRNLARHHKWPQMSFLYIEPREVRHELLLRVRDVIEWTRVIEAGPQSLTESAKDAVKQAAIDFSAQRNPVLIDGKRVTPDVSRAEFLSISPTGLQVIETGEAVDVSSAIIGISHGYWVARLPQSAMVEWELFDERINEVPTTVTDPVGPFPGFVTPDAPRLEWQNFLKDFADPEVLPVLTNSGHWLDWPVMRSNLLGSPGEESAAVIVDRLLHNAANVFRERDPAEFTREFGVFVSSGDEAAMAAELARAFAIPTRGGGTALVSALSNLRLEEIGRTATGDGFSVVAAWNQLATGQHWGHVDSRQLDVRAVMDVDEFDGAWKLTGFTVVELTQLGPESLP